MSTTGVITATGTKGLLQYLKTYQPALYAKANPVLLAAAKKQNGLGCMRRMGRLGRLGDVDPDTGMDLDDLSIPIDSGPIIGATLPPDLVIPSTSNATDSASVASSGPTSAGFANIISSIANGFSTATLTQAQISANNTLLQTNLARAQQGLPPLTATSTATGLSVASSGNMLLLGGALLIGMLVLGNKKAA
jgi:hypothetical protein